MRKLEQNHTILSRTDRARDWNHKINGVDHMLGAYTWCGQQLDAAKQQLMKYIESQTIQFQQTAHAAVQTQPAKKIEYAGTADRALATLDYFKHTRAGDGQDVAEQLMHPSYLTQTAAGALLRVKVLART